MHNDNSQNINRLFLSIMNCADKHSNEFEQLANKLISLMKIELSKNDSIEDKDKRIKKDIELICLYAVFSGFLARSIQKEMSRWLDDRDLRIGNKSREKLRQENHIKINFDNQSKKS